jgi:hypothetical protein
MSPLALLLLESPWSARAAGSLSVGTIAGGGLRSLNDAERVRLKTVETEAAAASSKTDLSPLQQERHHVHSLPFTA